MTFLVVAVGLSPLLSERSALYGWLLAGTTIVLFLLWRRYQEKVVRVRVSERKIVILKNAQEEEASWSDVESLTQWIVANPPFYRMKVKGKAGHYLFVTQPYFIDSGLGVIDVSDMGDFIRRKKKELGI